MDVAEIFRQFFASILEIRQQHLPATTIGQKVVMTAPQKSQRGRQRVQE